MIYVCSRCGREYGCYCGCYSEEDERETINRLEDCINHKLPENVHVCPDCYHYLNFASSFITNVLRGLFDEDYRNGNINSHGKSSRQNPKCREFDITYGFINPKNNRYYDETEDNK